MERIYMHDNNNSKRNKRKKKQSLASSFVIAFVAIFGLIVVGFNQISFAIPEEEEHLGESFISQDPGVNVTGRAIGDSYNFNVPQFYTKNGDLVFCLERDIPYIGDKEYKRDIKIEDAGLIYLLASVYPNESFAPGLDLEARVWLSQSAIWIYAYKNGYPNNTSMNDQLVSDVYNEVRLYSSNGTPGTYIAEITVDDINAGINTLYQKYGVDKILEDANRLKNIPISKLTANRNSDEISMTADGKYYQTDYVNVVATVSSDRIGYFNGYEIKYINVPNGTIVIDENGNKVDDITNMAPGSKFALRVPVESVNNNNLDMDINILGSFKTYVAHKYIAVDSQTVTSVKQINNNLSVPLDIQLHYTPRVPDTSLDKSKPYFYIGIILLLSGLGIFYTSAKKD